MGIRDFLSNEGISFIRDSLANNAIDIATAAARIKTMQSSLQTGVEQSSAIKNSIKHLFDNPQHESDDVIVRVRFSGEACISNVVDLKKWSTDWHDIARGIAMAHEIAPEEIRVIGARKGSIIIELATAALVAKTLSIIMLEILKVVERVLTIRKQAAEIRALNLSNTKLAQDIDTAADEEKTNEVERIVNEVVKRVSLQNSSNGDVQVALTSSIKKLVIFVEKGGAVDCVLPRIDDAAEEEAQTSTRRAELEELQQSVSEIRALEARVRLLGKV